MDTIIIAWLGGVPATGKIRVANVEHSSYVEWKTLS